MRVPLLIAVALLLNACGVPPAISAASWVADGISFAASGKSITDHGISIVVQQDCAIFRMVRGDEICRPYEDTGIEYADADAADGDRAAVLLADAAQALAPASRGKGTVPAVVTLSEANPFVAADDGAAGRLLFADAAGDTAVFELPGARSAVRVPGFDVFASSTVAGAVRLPAPPRPSYYFVVGSFESRHMAERLARRLDEFPSRILPGIAAGAVIHRVAVGPIAVAESEGMRRRLRAYGIDQPWVIDACGPHAPAIGCPTTASTTRVVGGPHG